MSIAEVLEPTTRRAHPGWSLGLRAKTAAEMISRVERGFTTATLDRIKRRLDLSTDEVAEVIGVSARTLARRRDSGRLETVESDRLMRLARLFERAVAVFGAEDEARRWFHQSQLGLGGATPLEFARTEPGSREVEALLDRIDFGVLA